jgi:deoxyribonuclease IV
VALEFGAHVSAAGGVDLALDRAAEFAMTSCQVFTKNERQWNAKPLDPGVVERFLARCCDRGMGTIISHDSYLINMATPDDSLWERSRLAIQEELRRCDELKIPYLVSHPGAHVGSGMDAGIPRIAEAINRVHDEMPDGKSMILLETTAGQGTTIGSKFEELAAIIDLVADKARVGVCLDTCHVFAAGYELRNAAGFKSTLDAFDSIIGLSRLKCIHLNDSQKGLGSRVDRHTHIGEGELGDSAFTLIVNEPRLNGLPGVLETPKGDDEKADGINLARLRGLVRASA